VQIPLLWSVTRLVKAPLPVRVCAQYVLFAYGLRAVLEGPFDVLAAGLVGPTAMIAALAVLLCVSATIEYRLYRMVLIARGTARPSAAIKAGWLMALSYPGWRLIASVVQLLDPGA
jgi:hypothetical protein